MKFRKKPVVIEAIQMPGYGEDASPELWALIKEHDDWRAEGESLIIPTLEGDMTASPRDWIIRGVSGEYYPCKPDIFAATYEPADALDEINAFFAPEAIKKAKGLNYSQALALIKTGHRLQRAGWNGKGMFVFLVAGSNFAVNREPLLSILGEGTQVTHHPHIDICHPDGAISVWQPSMGDNMAEDWQVVEVG